MGHHRRSVLICGLYFSQPLRCQRLALVTMPLYKEKYLSLAASA